MLSVVVVGAGHIGSTIASFLADSGGYRVTVLDRCERRLAALPRHPAIRAQVADAGDHDALVGCLDGAFAVLSAAPYHQTIKIAEAARVAQVHYLDLTEDVASTRAVRALADGAPTAFIPQCGLAPGFISIVAADLAARFDALHDVRLRVGALPKYPSNALNYNLTWSTDGVINEYCEPCEAIVDGQLRHTRALEECESFALDGVMYEAFNTSGGLGSLCESLAGKVRNLNYRTIRYPGHAAIMKALLNDLRLRDRRDLLKDILEHAVPVTLQDVVILFVAVSGMQGGTLVQETYAHKIYAREICGRTVSAIQITTASAICAVVDMLAHGGLPTRGFVSQEGVPLAAFLANRFGRAYAVDSPPAPAAPRREIAFSELLSGRVAGTGGGGWAFKPHQPPKTEFEMSENRIAGAAKKAGGAIEEATGKAIGNPTMEAKGAANKAAGTVQNAAGKVQDKVGAAIRK